MLTLKAAVIVCLHMARSASSTCSLGGKHGTKNGYHLNLSELAHLSCIQTNNGNRDRVNKN